MAAIDDVMGRPRRVPGHPRTADAADAAAVVAALTAEQVAAPEPRPASA